MARVPIPADIAKRSEGFAGRLWVLDQVVDWLDHGSERFFLITGDPGSGKTTLSAWLAGAGLASKDPHAGPQLERVRGLWGAAHFCLAEDQRGTLDPNRFSQSLARQLADHYDNYAKLVLQHVAPEISIDQYSRENWGHMVGVQIDTFIVNAKAEYVYSRVIRDPLDKLLKHQPGQRVFILVDALDEALTFEGPNIFTLVAGSGDLLAGVRFLLTSRNEPKVTDKLKNVRHLNLSSPKYAHDCDADIRAYVQQRLAQDAIKKRVGAVGSLAETEIENHLVKYAAGNFLYTAILLDEVATSHRSLADLTSLPRGLYGLYRDYLDRIMPEMVQVGTSQRWLEQFQPLLGCLSVAIPAAPLDALPNWLRLPPSVVSALLNDVMQVTAYEASNEGGYRLYHRSMAEFLAAATYLEDGVPIPNRYYTPPYEQHERIVLSYLKNFKGEWADCDAYGLRHLVSHVRARLDLEQKPKERKKQVADLYAVILDETFRRAQRDKLYDTTVTLTDLQMTLDIALKHDDVVKALACAGAYRNTIQSANIAQGIFAAIDKGDFTDAQQRAKFYRAAPDWARVLQLYLAWEAAEAGHVTATQAALTAAKRRPLVQAHALCDALLVRAARALARVLNDPRDAGAWLVEWGFDQNTDRLLASYDLAQPLTSNERQNLLGAVDQRVAYMEQTIAEGQAEAVSMVLFIDEERAGAYANNLRDLLVKLAADPSGQESIDRALKPVLTNPYPRYRDIALVALGIASLAVPDPSWVRQRLRRILSAALDREGVAFMFDVPSILLAEAERRHRPAPELAEYLRQAHASMDRWGTAARARSAHAAALFRQGEKDAAFTQLLEAGCLPSGFAGYASVTLVSLANRCYEFGMPEQAASPIWGLYRNAALLDEAMSLAKNVRDRKFQDDRIKLVEAQRTWSTHLNDKAAVALIINAVTSRFDPRTIIPTFLHLIPMLPAAWAMLSDHAVRMAFIDHLSAQASWPPDKPNWDGLKALVLPALEDGTTLDAVLGRLLGLRVHQFSDDDLAEVIGVCTTYLTTSRPWELGQWH